MFTFTKGFDTYVNSQLLRVQERLKTRLIDDFVYALEKKKKKEFLKEIEGAIALIIKDGMIDTIRDFRHKFMKKSQGYLNKIEIKYEQYGVKIKGNEEVCVLELINKYFKAGLSYNSFAVLSSQLKNIFEHARINALSSLHLDLDTVLKEAFVILIDNVKEKADELSKNLTEEFFIRLEEPLQLFEKNLDREVDILSTKINNFENDEKKTEYSLLVHKQIKALDVLSQRCVI
ncbi:hypothetical protein JHD50_06465 [Sulfurimonas sp. MAG313]|nr:hypothetical protein [Sulfurimonas sp. MAG313]